jgi:hypothetical protein
LSGWRVSGSTTRAEKLEALKSCGIQATLLRLEPQAQIDESYRESEGLQELFSNSTIVLNIPPQTTLLANEFTGIVDSFLSRLAVNRERAAMRGFALGRLHLVFVSSTSVYGENQGDVDESTELLPDSESGLALAKVELHLATVARQRSFDLTIVRPGGLIGPGRHPGRFLAGRKSCARALAPVNWIELTDLILCLEKICLERKTRERLQSQTDQETVQIFNLTARTHPTRSSFYTRAAIQLGVEPPEFLADEVQPNQQPGKTVRSEKIRKLLQIEFRYDDIAKWLNQKEDRS